MAEHTRGQNASQNKGKSYPNELGQKTDSERGAGRRQDTNNNSSNRRGEMRSKLFAKRNLDDSYFDGQLSDE